MSRMSGPRRDKVYEMLARRDGECCFIGGEPSDRESLVVDHWNNRNNDNRPSNLHLVCRSMNSVKNPRGQLTKESEILSSVSVRRPVVDGIIRPQMIRVESGELLKNLQNESLFRHWLFYQIVHCHELEYHAVVNCAAEYVHCSPQSIRRYLEKLTCKIGIYRYVEVQEVGKKLITLKPKFETFRKTIEKRSKLIEQARNWKSEDIKQPNLANVISI